MVAGFPATLCNLPNQNGINPAIGDTDRPLIGFIVLKFFRKLHDGSCPQIQPYMLLRSGKMEDIMVFPIGWHTPVGDKKLSRNQSYLVCKSIYFSFDANSINKNITDFS